MTKENIIASSSLTMQDIADQLKTQASILTILIEAKKLELRSYDILYSEVVSLERNLSNIELARSYISFNIPEEKTIPLAGTESAWGDAS